MGPFAWTVVFSLVAGAATVLGGVIITIPGKIGRVRLSHLIAFGAGYMLSAVFVTMVPESFELTPNAPLWILCGYVLAHLFEHAFTTHFHYGEETHHDHAIEPGVSTTALVGLALHAFFDGVAISSGFLVTPSLGIFIALAVILHKIPEGVTIASVMIASGGSASRARSAAALLAVATLVGALLMTRMAPFRGPALALSCGIAVYVAATDLMPEFNRQRERRFSLSALSGMILYFGVFQLMRAAGLH